jgi:hypothetical protein
MHSPRYLRGLVAAMLALPLLSMAEDRARTPAMRIMAATADQGKPSITILAAASGAPLQTFSPGSASLNLGRAAYYGGHSASGVSQQKNTGSMVLMTRFALKIDCGGGQSSLAEVRMTLLLPDPSYAVSVDGTKLSTAEFPTILRCGSVSEHRVEIEVPKTRPAGPIGSTVSFSAIAK